MGKINIPQEILVNYHQFGVLLLEDDNAVRIRPIVHKHKDDAEQINMEVLEDWIKGRGRQPVTWKTLADVLHSIELNTLAGDIEAVKIVPINGAVFDNTYTAHSCSFYLIATYVCILTCSTVFCVHTHYYHVICTRILALFHLL